MRLTRFFQLKEAVRQLQAREGIDGLAFRLQEEPFRIDPAELVYGEAGIFLISKEGAVCRVLLYDSEKTVDSERMDPILRNNVLSGGFDNPSLIEQLPRYHLLHCETLAQQQQSNWTDNKAWQISQRSSDRFIFRYLTRTGVLCDMDTQKLLPCESCIEKIHDLGFINSRAAPQSAGQWMALLEDNKFYTRTHGPHTKQCPSTPKNLIIDWHQITAKYTRLRQCCEGTDCPLPDAAMLADEELQSHYLQRDKDHRHFYFIKNLCPHCHARQKGHQRMNYSPELHAFNEKLAAISE